MTYASEEQRNDDELNAAVLEKLIKHREDLIKAIGHMQAAYKILYDTDDLRDMMYSEGHHIKARANLRNDVDRMSWFITNILDDVGSDNSAYVGNVAAFQTPAKASKLKEEYRKGKD